MASRVTPPEDNEFIHSQDGLRIFKPMGYGVPKLGDWFIPWNTSTGTMPPYVIEMTADKTTYGTARIICGEVPSVCFTTYNVSYDGEDHTDLCQEQVRAFVDKAFREDKRLDFQTVKKVITSAEFERKCGLVNPWSFALAPKPLLPRRVRKSFTVGGDSQKGIPSQDPYDPYSDGALFG